MYMYEFRENPMYVFSNKTTLFSLIHILREKNSFQHKDNENDVFLIIVTFLHIILRKCITLYNKIIAEPHEFENNVLDN